MHLATHLYACDERVAAHQPPIERLLNAERRNDKEKARASRTEKLKHQQTHQRPKKSHQTKTK